MASIASISLSMKVSGSSSDVIFSGRVRSASGGVVVIVLLVVLLLSPGDVMNPI